MSRRMTLILFAALFALFGLAGVFELDDAEQEAARYCDNVRAGLWPAYDDEVDCKHN